MSVADLRSIRAVINRVGDSWEVEVNYETSAEYVVAREEHTVLLEDFTDLSDALECARGGMYASIHRSSSKEL